MYTPKIFGLLSILSETAQLIVAILLLLATILTTIVLGFLIKYMLHVNSSDHIGYVPTNLGRVGPVLKQVVDKYIGKDTQSYNLVEPGAGFANVAYYLNLNYKWKQTLAIEDETATLLLASIKQLFRPNKISYIKANVVNYKFPEKSVVYSYLLTEILDKIHAQNQFKGSLLISLTFPLTGVEPTEIIILEGFQKQILIYDFR